DCTATVGSIPEPAHLQNLRLTYGDTSRFASRLGGALGGRQIDFGVPITGKNIDFRGLLAYSSPNVPPHSQQALPGSEQRDCEHYGDCGVAYTTVLPVLAHHEIELHGAIEEYWAMGELRVTTHLSAPGADESKTCDAFEYSGWFNDEAEAQTRLRAEWARLPNAQ
ncbi:MAG: hypothetical protein ABUS57_09490, partial [Pseudomonadota bacterium]